MCGAIEVLIDLDVHHESVPRVSVERAQRERQRKAELELIALHGQKFDH